MTLATTFAMPIPSVPKDLWLLSFALELGRLRVSPDIAEVVAEFSWHSLNLIPPKEAVQTLLYLLNNARQPGN